MVNLAFRSAAGVPDKVYERAEKWTAGGRVHQVWSDYARQA